MLDLNDIRNEIDGIDEQIVKLFEVRMQRTQEVAEYKISTGKAIFDKEREEEKLNVLGAMATSEFNARSVRELFAQIMSISRKRQYQLLAGGLKGPGWQFALCGALPLAGKKVVFQGVEGAYSFAAMQQFFSSGVSGFPVAQWKDAMEALALGQADYAVLPIENSTAGVVQDIYDLLMEYDNCIIGEEFLKVDHVLMGVKGSTKKDIRTVYSHPQALAQCRAYLQEHSGWRQNEYPNTAQAAQKVALEGDRSQAAIASRYAAEHFGLDILEQAPLCMEGNSTRFIVVSKEKLYTKKADKISICFELPHTSGTLYNVLSHLMFNGLNMTRIESRSIPKRHFEYRFFVDFEGNLSNDAVKNALIGIKQEALNLRILGNYSDKLSDRKEEEK